MVLTTTGNSGIAQFFKNHKIERVIQNTGMHLFLPSGRPFLMIYTIVYNFIAATLFKRPFYKGKCDKYIFKA